MRSAIPTLAWSGRLLGLSAVLLASTIAARAEPPAADAPIAEPPVVSPQDDHGVVPDDLLTLVVGTHFVKPTAEGTTAKAQFTEARIPLADFNDTDTCIDQSMLEVAKEYFTTLGRMMEKAGHYYFVPDAEIRKSAAMCERMHQQPPKAWVDGETKIIAFGRVVATEDAPALERTLR